MLGWTNMDGTGTATSYTNQAAVIVGGQPVTVLPWLATARDLSDRAGHISDIREEASRTATTCYMVGLKEKMLLQSNSGQPWMWRRICFTSKSGSDLSHILLGNTGAGGYSNFIELASGFVRPLNSINSQTVQQNLGNLLFKGVYNVDFFDPMTAIIDTRRISVKYDKQRTINPGNAVGVQKRYNMWFPMNKNLVYDDDEAGGDESSAFVSVTDNQGMGDYWIIDFFRCNYTSTTSDQLRVETSASLYWHEK